MKGRTRAGVAFWENLWPRVTGLDEVCAAADAEANAAGRTCGTELPLTPLGYACTRKPDHGDSRHVAIGHRLDESIICAAWPGDHEPTLADLEAPK